MIMMLNRVVMMKIVMMTMMEMFITGARIGSMRTCIV
jgi:hypothetical protein